MKGENIMLTKINEGLELAYESIIKKPMTVGTVKPGDLEGKTKEKGPSKSGAENTDAKKAENAPAELQGDTVEGSKKKGKTMSKFDELYSNVVKEEVAPSIEGKEFDTDTKDFPPAGEEEAAAEDVLDVDDEVTDGESLADLFASFADIASKIADKYREEEGGDIITDEPEMGEDEEISAEAVESTPAPDSVGKLTSKANMNVKGVKVTKQTACSKASGAKNGGEPEVAPDTTLNPKMKLKANGSGSAVDGKDAKFFG